jgi:hypothetical protein
VYVTCRHAVVEAIVHGGFGEEVATDKLKWIYSIINFFESWWFPCASPLGLFTGCSNFIKPLIIQYGGEGGVIKDMYEL